MEPEVWLQVFGAGDSGVLEALSKGLAAAGLKIRPLGPLATQAPGVVLFEEFSASLCTFIEDTSRGGRDRVLVVGLSPEALERGSSWALLKAGASDVLVWRPSADPVGEIRCRVIRWLRVDETIASPAIRKSVIGVSPEWISVLRQVVEVASFTDSPVLITGESGTGKELVAQLIHALDARPEKRRFIVLDCTTVVPELAGSEFFGHERGAFTGAVASRDGAFALADGGTLFLDEVGELTPGLQAELLRVVQEGTYKRVGSDTWRHTRFRLICATHRDLLQEERSGRFRRDFYYRIAGWTCRLPPLHDRSEDILPLVQHFLQQLLPDGDIPDLDEPVRQLLLQRAYPGNVRDLKQLVSQIASRHVGAGPITVGDVPPDEWPPEEATEGSWCDLEFERAIRRAVAYGARLKEISAAAIETAIRVTVQEEHGNLQRSALRLGVTARALQLRRAKHRRSA